MILVRRVQAEADYRDPILTTIYHFSDSAEIIKIDRVTMWCTWMVPDGEGGWKAMDEGSYAELPSTLKVGLEIMAVVPTGFYVDPENITCTSGMIKKVAFEKGNGNGDFLFVTFGLTKAEADAGGPTSGGTTITVPVSNDNNEVKVEAAVFGHDATLKPLDSQQIQQIVGDAHAAGKWYTEAIRWAASENIVGGYSATTSSINDAITRE